MFLITVCPHIIVVLYLIKAVVKAKLNFLETYYCEKP